MTSVRKQLPVPECDGDDWYDRIRCAWDECENPGSALITWVKCNAAGVLRHPASHGKCYWCETRAYCCAQHRDYDARSHRPGEYGTLGAGVNPRFFLTGRLCRCPRYLVCMDELELVGQATERYRETAAEHERQVALGLGL